MPVSFLLETWMIFSCGFTALTCVLLLLHFFNVLGPFYQMMIQNSGNHQRHVHIFDTVPLKTRDVVFLGDSITAGGPWSELFEDRLIKNRGIDGDTTSGVLARLEQLTRSQPSRVFLLVGTNDLFLGIAEGDIIKNILSVTTRLKRANPETHIFLQSILPRGAKYKDRVEAVNKKLAESLSSDVTWIDLYPLFLDDRKQAIDPRFSNDALHLNGTGYQVWKDAIEDYIEVSPSPQ